ncbi:putative undecaprenyl-phosphate N-acetylglucosaminyl 1-phosphate transferase [Paenibacillus sp. CECT 9249]|nr:putative undecaprenyl-phosphate N-acetylglucosaminyl 1-phosphate transferase [Paenibacillus sp. CECT 9249]
MAYMLGAAMSFAFVLALVPWMKRLAVRTGFVDRPGKRKIHRDAVPLLGGAAIYAGCLIALIALKGLGPLTWTIVIGGTLLLLVGLLDDRYKSLQREFPVWPRIIVYLASATVPLFFGIEISGMRNLWRPGMILFPDWFVWIATVIWVFAITNMMNFIDGVDGLAAGVAGISSITLFIVAILRGDTETAVSAAVIAGACIAFLLYNFPPAKIFMGDAGAIFLGYTLAIVSMEGAYKSAALVSMLVPALALGFPIMDTVIVFTRRLLHGKGLHRADKLHTHHALLRWGLSQSQTVSFLYLVAALFGLLSIVTLLIFMMVYP